MGGQGSGHHGHSGRPGKVGGSYPANYEWTLVIKGGPGSGNFGHAGRPGLVGGSGGRQGLPAGSTKFSDINEPKWAGSLSSEEKKALAHYTEGGFDSINNGLRGNGRMSYDDQDAAQTIDSALNRNRTQKEITVYRGFGTFQDADWLEEGDTFVDDGFSSTAVIGREMFQTRVTADIIIPAGSRGAYIEGFSSTVDQQEFLLPSGTEFRVLSKKETGGGLEFILEVIS